MRKGQRKFWTALLTLIAAIAGGWAVHVGLSYQDNSITAEDGGVVSQNIQGSPTTHTGSGNIDEGVRHQGEGDIHIWGSLEGGQDKLVFLLGLVVIVLIAVGLVLFIAFRGKDTYHIHGIPPEKYVADLRRREQEVTEKLKQAHAVEKLKQTQAHAEDRRLLETELAEIKSQLANTEASYQTRIQKLEKRIAELKAVPDELLDKARDTLIQGDLSRADALFAEIQDQPEAPIRAVAEAAYQRSGIAEYEVRYRGAYAHAQRAVQLAPKEARYLRNAGQLAQLLGDYQAAKDYHKQALAIDLDTLGEDHSDVATDRNNLGGAWKALGENRKAIGFYEQALAVLEHRLGLEHPHTRTARKNLAAARAEQEAADNPGR